MRLCCFLLILSFQYFLPPQATRKSLATSISCDLYRYKFSCLYDPSRLAQHIVTVGIIIPYLVQLYVLYTSRKSPSPNVITLKSKIYVHKKPTRSNSRSVATSLRLPSYCTFVLQTITIPFHASFTCSR